MFGPVEGPTSSGRLSAARPRWPDRDWLHAEARPTRWRWRWKQLQLIQRRPPSLGARTVEASASGSPDVALARARAAGADLERPHAVVHAEPCGGASRRKPAPVAPRGPARNGTRRHTAPRGRPRAGAPDRRPPREPCECHVRAARRQRLEQVAHEVLGGQALDQLGLLQRHRHLVGDRVQQPVAVRAAARADAQPAQLLVARRQDDDVISTRGPSAGSQETKLEPSALGSSRWSSQRAAPSIVRTPPQTTRTATRAPPPPRSQWTTATTTSAHPRAGAPPRTAARSRSRPTRATTRARGRPVSPRRTRAGPRCAARSRRSRRPSARAIGTATIDWKRSSSSSGTYLKRGSAIAFSRMNAGRLLRATQPVSPSPSPIDTAPDRPA